VRESLPKSPLTKPYLRQREIKPRLINHYSNLVANDSNTWSDVFVRDLQTGTTTMVSVNSAGLGNGNQDSLAPVISANGRVVIFKSFASNLIANDNNNTTDVFARDLQTGITILVSCNATCTASGNGASFPAPVPKDKAPRALISKDGRFVVFESNATDLVTLSDSNGSTDVFVRDLQSNTTSLVSVDRFGTGSGDGGGTQPVISGNGRFVFFQSSSTNLTANGAPFSFNLFVRDLQAGGVTTMVSVTTSNTASVGPSNLNYFPVASDDGRYVIFQSDAKTYVSNDSNNASDIFLRDLQTDTTTLISVNTSGVSGSNSALASAMNLELLPNETASAVTASADDEIGNTYSLPVEYVGMVPAVSGLSEVVVRLPDNVGGAKELWIKITLRGETSNRAPIRIAAP
jgi:hypothetical protein